MSEWALSLVWSAADQVPNSDDDDDDDDPLLQQVRKLSNMSLLPCDWLHRRN